MIVLAALLLFLITLGVKTLNRHLRSAGHPVTRHQAADAAAAPFPVDPSDARRTWTALDELQLNRLLKDAAP